MPSEKLPSFDELPNFKNFTGCAWSVWGENDQLGTVNLLTPEVIQRAANEEIKTGHSVSVNWPINFPEKPLFGRKSPHILRLKRTSESTTRDDEIHINTQSGSQWDGLRHFGVLEHNVIYNNTAVSSIHMGHYHMPDPLKIDPELIKFGIHNWAQHGICGRGVFLDVVKFFIDTQGKLPYDPFRSDAIGVQTLLDCAKAQGVVFRQGDILIIRFGFIQKYYASSQEEKDRLGNSPETFAGIEQSEDMKRFLWNNHFAAVASDQPTLERWPPREGNPYMHETILGLWGMPLGEIFDLEALSELSAKLGRYTFFFSSWPLNILGGCASPPNAAAIF